MSPNLGGCALLLGTWQSLPKFHPAMDGLLSRLLDALPDALLVIVYDKAKVLWKNRLRDRLAG